MLSSGCCILFDQHCSSRDVRSLCADVLKPLHEVECERYNKLGRVYGHYEGKNALISVGDPSLLREILVKDFQSFTGRRTFDTGDKVIDKMLSIIRGEDWKRVRTVVTPTFTTGKIKRNNFNSKILRAASTRCSALEEGIQSRASQLKFYLAQWRKKTHQRQSISLETKLAILDRLGKGEGSTAIGKHFNLGESTVRAIKKNEAAIRKSVISGTKLSTKFASYRRDVLLERTERAIAIWIEEQVQRRIPVSGYLIQEKALQFYKSMKQSEPSTSTSLAGKEFSASKGWLTGFLKRNALHNIKITGESATADEGAPKMFPEELAKIIEDGDYSADQVFNADETRLYWKKLPNRTYIAKDEKTASGHKASKDRVTLLLCSNASGDQMLKPLLINKSLRLRVLKGKDLKQLPVHWMANPKAWMTTAIFTEWFNNCFVPEVEAYMKEKSLDFKVLFIVDNAASHPQLEHPSVQLVFHPPNTTSLIPPLDQGIIATFKKYYIKTTYKFILNKLENESLTVKDVWKQFSIFDCLIHVASASAQIRPRTLNACWKKIWPACVTDNTTTQTSTLSDEIINLAHEIGGDGFNTFSHDDIDELLVGDALSDNDIIDLTLDLTVYGVVGLEGDNDEEEKSTPLTGKLIQEGLQLCSKLENHFLINAPNSERASKLQRELQNCMSGYRELYKKIKESSSQSLITDYIVRKGRAAQNEKEVCENPWPLPQISIAETISSDDEGDLEPLRKRCKPLSDSDTD
ncbi:tigger transposable element-derived protein 1 [Trichonephila clavipes]|nr:tigger transposable element-derived protein 1 [Trichonephila clavipes]